MSHVLSCVSTHKSIITFKLHQRLVIGSKASHRISDDHGYRYPVQVRKTSDKDKLRQALKRFEGAGPGRARA